MRDPDKTCHKCRFWDYQDYKSREELKADYSAIEGYCRRNAPHPSGFESGYSLDALIDLVWTICRPEEDSDIAKRYRNISNENEHSATWLNTTGADWCGEFAPADGEESSG